MGPADARHACRSAPASTSPTSPSTSSSRSGPTSPSSSTSRSASERRRVELLVELDRSGRASSNYEKFRRYDALINGWGCRSRATRRSASRRSSCSSSRTRRRRASSSSAADSS